MKPLNFFPALIASLALFAHGAILTNDVPFAAAALGAPVVHDGYLYLSADNLSGGGLAVFDLSKPATPVFAAGVRTAGPATDAPAFLGDTAYLPTAAGIEVFDVTRPEEPAPVRLVTPHAPGPTFSSVSVKGERLVAPYGDGIRLYDISDPFSPLLTDAAPLCSVDHSRTFMVAAPFSPESVVTSLSNRIFRIDSGRFVDCGPLPADTPAFTNAIAIHFVTENIAYLADGPDAVVVADFTDPRRPDIARCTNVPSSFLRPQGQRGRLYAGSSNILDVISVWKPLEPHLSRTVVFPPSVDVRHLRIAGDYAYYADDKDCALRTYSIAESNAVLTAEARFPYAPGKVALAELSPLQNVLEGPPLFSFDLAPLPQDETIKEDIAIVGSRIVRSHGLPDARPDAIAAADLAAPLKTTSVLPLEGVVHGFCADSASNLLFVADSLAIHLLRLTNGGLAEEARLPVSSHPLYGPRALALADGGTNQVLLAACGADGLRAYSRDGTNLVLMATGETGGFACDVAVSGDTVFVADRERGVTVCRLADGKLERIRTHALPRGSANAVAAKDGVAYIAAGEAGLAVLSAARPIPLAHGPHAPGAFALDLALFEREGRLWALVAEGRGGLALFDVTDPKAPVSAWRLTDEETGRPIFDWVVAVCTDGRRACALDARFGLFVVDLDIVFKEDLAPSGP